MTEVRVEMNEILETAEVTYSVLSEFHRKLSPAAATCNLIRRSSNSSPSPASYEAKLASGLWQRITRAFGTFLF